MRLNYPKNYHLNYLGTKSKFQNPAHSWVANRWGRVLREHFNGLEYLQETDRAVTPNSQQFSNLNALPPKAPPTQPIINDPKGKRQHTSNLERGADHSLGGISSPAQPTTPLICSHCLGLGHFWKDYTNPVRCNFCYNYGINPPLGQSRDWDVRCRAKEMNWTHLPPNAPVSSVVHSWQNHQQEFHRLTEHVFTHGELRYWPTPPRPRWVLAGGSPAPSSSSSGGVPHWLLHPGQWGLGHHEAGTPGPQGRLQASRRRTLALLLWGTLCPHCWDSALREWRCLCQVQ